MRPKSDKAEEGGSAEPLLTDDNTVGRRASMDDAAHLLPAALSPLLPVVRPMLQPAVASPSIRERGPKEAGTQTAGEGEGHAAVPGAGPLRAAYAQLTAVFPALRVLETDSPHAGDSWVTARQLACGEVALEQFLAREQAQLLRDQQRPARPDVVATFALHRYAWPVCLLVTIPWFLHRRVPTLPLDAVSFQRSTGQLSLRLDEFACLPDDPAASDPRARTVPDEAALRAAVRESLAGHLEPVLHAFRPRTRRGARALWGMATDEITEGLWYLGFLLGAERRARDEAEQLLPGNTPPYTRGAGFRELIPAVGPSLTTRDRASCCLYYTLRPEDTCVTCPRTRDVERIERMTEFG